MEPALLVKPVGEYAIIIKRDNLGKETQIHCTLENAKLLRDQLEEVIDKIQLEMEKEKGDK